MRLRPSTPLSVVLLAAFGMLMLSVISTPVLVAIPLGQFKDFTYGVFGFCQGSKCTSISIGYDMSTPLGTDNRSFDIPRSVRDSLPPILILHAVAAVLTLALFFMAVASHWHSAAHSANFHLAFFIFSVITFLITLMSFIVDVLMFIPNLAWGSYMVLASAVLLALSAFVSCILRRTLITRKERRKNIEQNAEMSGENYYNRENSFKTPAVTQSSYAMSGANNVDTLPAFATFESKSKKEDTVSDEQIPLTSRTPSNAGSSNRQNTMGMSSTADTVSIDGSLNGYARPPRDPYGNPMNDPLNGPMGGPTRSMSRDRFGNPVNGPANGPTTGYGMARGPSTESMRSRGSQGYRGGRGGGYGRGGPNMYQPSPVRGRGGYGPPPARGGFGPRGGRGGGLAPPPRGGYMGGSMRGGRPHPPSSVPSEIIPYDRRPSPAEAYGSNGPYGPPVMDDYNSNSNQLGPDANAGYAPYNPPNLNYPRSESPAPMAGNPVEMDAVTNYNSGYVPYDGGRDNDLDGNDRLTVNKHATYASSKYSTDTLSRYLAPRAAWNQNQNQNQEPNPPNSSDPMGRVSPGNYYEDIDPRFAQPQGSNQQPHVIEPVYENDQQQTMPPGSRSPV